MAFRSDIESFLQQQQTSFEEISAASGKSFESWRRFFQIALGDERSAFLKAAAHFRKAIV
jgi:hypothetical protein